MSDGHGDTFFAGVVVGAVIGALLADSYWSDVPIAKEAMYICAEGELHILDYGLYECHYADRVVTFAAHEEPTNDR